MIFNSVLFIFFFFPLALMGYALLPQKVKPIFMVLLSVGFYINAGIRGFMLFAVLTVANYIIGKGIIRYSSKKKLILSLGIALDIGVLFGYKYLGFTFSIMNSLFGTSFKALEIAMPLGISFFVFAMTSYLVDIYRKEEQCKMVDFFLYVSFFPKVTSGPIVPYKNFMIERKNTTFNIDNVAKGLERFSIGLAKKVMIADILGVTADSIFNGVAVGIDTPTAWIGAICYTLQIYYDFSGYSDMAIGLAKMFGYNFDENFNFPYISKSVTEFWRRWHISLGKWFRNYLYIPLGGNRKGNVYLNLFIVFLATGIWHGANWTFILWGCGYGILIVLERIIMKKEWYNKIPSLVKWFFTFNIVNLGWVIFKSDGIRLAYKYILRMFGFDRPENIEFTWQYYLQNSLMVTMTIGLVGAILLSNEKIQNFLTKDTDKKPSIYAVKSVCLIILFIISIIYMINSDYSPFIYFQF